MSDLSALAQRVADFIEREELIKPDERILLAASGGLDSTVCLHLLLELGYRPDLAHVNYQLRGTDSEADAAFVTRLARQHDLACHLKVVNLAELLAEQTGENMQALARKIRYEFFQETTNHEGLKYNCIITAHHADDAFETFLINFLRGSGLPGLLGIAPRRSSGIARPLLETSRQEILDYAVANKIDWREDISNAKDDYLRNRLRNQVIPALRTIEPELTRRATGNFRRLRAAGQFYDEGLTARWNQLTWEDLRSWQHLDRGGFRKLKTELADSILQAYLVPAGFDRELRRQLLAAAAGSLLQTETHHALVLDKEVIIAKHPIDEPYFQMAHILAENRHTFFELCSIHKLRKALSDRPAEVRTPPTVLLLPHPLKQKLRFRRPRMGDRFRPFGMDGKTQKLQDFFVNNKVDRLERLHVWLLVDEADRILWVMGHRAAEETRLGPEEKKLIRLEMMTRPRERS